MVFAGARRQQVEQGHGGRFIHTPHLARVHSVYPQALINRLSHSRAITVQCQVITHFMAALFARFLGAQGGDIGKYSLQFPV